MSVRASLAFLLVGGFAIWFGYPPIRCLFDLEASGSSPEQERSGRPEGVDPGRPRSRFARGGGPRALPLRLEALRVESRWRDESQRHEAAEVALRETEKEHWRWFALMAGDPRQSNRWRGYCVQYVAVCFEKTDDLRSLRWLRDRLSDRPDQVAETAAFSLGRLVRERRRRGDPLLSLDVRDIDAELARVAGDTERSPVVRTAALRGRLLIDAPGIHDQCRDFAADEDLDLAIRVAAVQGLRDAEDEGAFAILASLRDHRSPVLARAAQRSLAGRTGFSGR